MNKLKKSLSKKIESINVDIIALGSLDLKYKTINLKTHITKLKNQKNDLISTSTYLDNLETELSTKLGKWYDNGCKGKVVITLQDGGNEK